MGRPAPQVLYSHNQEHWQHRVQAAPGLWVVTLQGQAVTLVESHLYQDLNRYRTVSFSQPAHANRLAARLNAQYQTQAFVVVKVL